MRHTDRPMLVHTTSITPSFCCRQLDFNLNPLIPTLKPQSNGSLYSSTVIGTLAVDGWTVTFGTARRGLPSPLLAVTNVTAHTSTASVPISYYSMWQYNCLCTIKGSIHLNCLKLTKHTNKVYSLFR